MNDDQDQRTIYCCNLSEKVDEELIYELFLQAGPVERVNMPKDQRTGEHRGIAFVEYAHKASVPYALQVFMGSKLHGRPLNMRSRNNSNPAAVTITPQYIEENNPLTASGAPLYRQSYADMAPARDREPINRRGGNPFEQFQDPALLMALSANFQAHGGGNAYQNLGKYDHREDERSYNKHRGHSYRRHEEYNPYRDDHDRRDNGGGGGGSYRERDRDRDRHRDWTNGSRGHQSNRRRF